jgi:rod shape determining protein RodA
MNFNILNSIFKNFYWSLFVILIFITLIGIVFIHTASYQNGLFENSYAFKQTIWLGISVLVMFLICMIGYKPFLNVSYLLFFCSLVLLVLVFFIGSGKYGAQRWIMLGGIAIQPSEFAKIAYILALAHYLGNREKNILQKKRFIIAFIITFIPLILIVKQPDLGTSLVFLPILFAVLYIWGTKLKYIIISITLGLTSVPILWAMLKEYQKKRLLTFINADADPLGAGYTAIQSKIAVGSGTMWGKGFFQGTQNRLKFVPEHHSDFIFCVIGEEGGFIATAFLLLLFLCLVILSIRTILKTTDPEAKLLIAGVTTMLVFQVFINIGMTIGLCPITGLPLPFISYGGSSLLTFFIAYGFIISIYKERSIF